MTEDQYVSALCVIPLTNILRSMAQLLVWGVRTYLVCVIEIMHYFGSKTTMAINARQP